MTSRNILFVTPHFYPAWSYGGTPRATWELSRYLVKMGHRVTVVTTDTLSKKERIKDYPQPEMIEGVTVYRFRNISNFLAYNFKLSLPLGLNSFLKKHLHKFDLIHLHEFRTTLNVLTLIHCRKNKTPIVLQPHGTFINYNSNQKLKSLFDAIFKDLITANAKHYIALSKLEKKDLLLQSIPQTKISIIPNGFKSQNYRVKTKLKKIPKDYLLYLGRIDGMKGLETLFQAFARIKNKHPQVKLVIAGTGTSPYVDQLKKMTEKLRIKSKVIWLGHVEGSNKNKLFQRAKISIYYSSKDAFGLVPLESIYQRTPVIISNQVGSRDIIKKLKAGLVVPINDNPISQLVLAINQVLFKPIEITKDTTTFLQNELGWEKISRRYSNMYSRLIK